LTSTHAPTAGKDEAAKEEFYSALEKVCYVVPNYYMETLLRDFNAIVGRESSLYLACGWHSLHNERNDARKRMVNFSTGKGFSCGGNVVSVSGHSQCHLAIT
jgi:hypothetical protein